MEAPATCLRDPLRIPLQRVMCGGLANPVALMQLLAAAQSAEEAEQAIAAVMAATEWVGDRSAAARLRSLAALWRENPQAWNVVKDVLGSFDHSAEGESPGVALERWRTAFDQVASRRPEASVALYSLGNAELLKAATDEVLDWMRSAGLLRAESRVLDFGCGIGRLTAPVAREVGAVTGIDISAAMIEAARKRCAGLLNVRLEQTSGEDLRAFPDRSFDLVYAVDCFPYLVPAGGAFVASHIAEVRRVLAPSGTLLIINYSYRGDLNRDAADLRRLGDTYGLRLVRSAEQPFSCWDGAVFELRCASSEGAN